MSEVNNDRRGHSSLVWALAILTLGASASVAIVWLAPGTKPVNEVRPPKIVQTVELTPTDERISVTAYGTVIPARQVVVQPEVRGRVIRQHPALVPGGHVASDSELIGIDPSDYELALTEQETLLEQARFEMEVERGRQVVASREWRLLQGDLPESETNRSLVLREPHRRKTEALVTKATNQIAKAKLDLSRTSVKAPFNAVVLSESVEIGQLVEPDREIATLVGTDEFWVRASLPIETLRRIELPSGSRAGASAQVILETGNGAPIRRQGTVVRLLSDLDTNGRMARVVIGVRDPLGLHDSSVGLPLLLGSYVRVEIEAGELNDVLSIQRAALRDGNRIWVVDSNQQLRIRPVEVLWTRKEAVLIANTVPKGEQLIVSGLRVALPGMKVRPRPVAVSSASPRFSHSTSEP